MNELAVNNVSLFFSFALVLIAVLISQKEKLTLSKDILLSILRAIIQLTLVGYVLKYLFHFVKRCRYKAFRKHRYMKG